jgi:hypothetical protein
MDFLAKLIMCLEADSARKITLQLVIENDRDDVIAKFVAVNRLNLLKRRTKTRKRFTIK